MIWGVVTESLMEKPIKIYLISTGVIFGLITALHIWKAVAEGPQTAKNPFFILLTALTCGLSIWAGWLVLRRRSR
jgi:NO-binding membrane sensor protein with MHYT domain